MHAKSQMRALLHAISLAVNYRLFSHGDVSYRFKGKNDNVVLECLFTSFYMLMFILILVECVINKGTIDVLIEDNCVYNSCYSSFQGVLCF